MTCAQETPVRWIKLGEPYAAAGEKVTCENGHVICEFVKPVRTGDVQDVATTLGAWRDPEPAIGQIPIPRCARCSAPWTDGMSYHFDDGWRRADNRARLVVDRCDIRTRVYNAFKRIRV